MRIFFTRADLGPIHTQNLSIVRPCLINKDEVMLKRFERDSNRDFTACQIRYDRFYASVHMHKLKYTIERKLCTGPVERSLAEASRSVKARSLFGNRSVLRYYAKPLCAHYLESTVPLVYTHQFQ